MKERIILAPSASGTEIARSLSKYGINTIGLRILRASELADIMLTKSGVIYGKEFVTYREQCAMIFSVLNKVPYFKSASYADAENIASSLNRLRDLVDGNERTAMRRVLSGGEFPEKNRALLEVYEKYTALCDEKNCGDRADKIRFAIDNAASLETPVETVREFPLSPLEKRLCGAACSQKKQICLAELFGKTESTEVSAESFTAAYGASNEVDDIIGRIFTEKIPLDKCVVAVADTARYSQLFYEASERYGIPVTFGCGVSILNTNPARLLKALYKWQIEGQCGVDSLKELFGNPAFSDGKLTTESGLNKEYMKRALKIAGYMRLGFNQKLNSERIEAYEMSLPDTFVDEKDERKDDRIILPSLTRMFGELGKGYSYVIRNYSVIREGEPGVLDASAVSLICESLDSFDRFSAGTDSKAEDIIPMILSKRVYSRASSEGCLHVCGFSNALSAVRENLFAAGLSADAFPGKPVENYLLLDSDYDGLEGAPTTSAVIERRNDMFRSILSLYSALGNRIFISYADFDTSTLKDANMSSAVFDLSGKCDIRKAGFFDYVLSPSSAVGKEYKSGAHADGATPRKIAQSVKYDLKKGFSPSGISTYLACPRQYLLKYVLHIDEPDPDNPYEVINARDFGTVAHRALETIRPGTDEKEYLENAMRELEDFFRLRPPLIENMAWKAREDFEKTAINGFNLDRDFSDAEEYSEKLLEGMHESGIEVHGYPDKVEIMPDGRYVIVDYKTGRNLAHASEDVGTCYQALLYAYLLEKKFCEEHHPERKVDHVEFRYTRLDDTVSCAYNDETKQELFELLSGLAATVEKGECMPLEKCEVASPYCKYGPICRKVLDYVPGEGDE